MRIFAWVCGVLGGLAGIAFDVLPGSITDNLKPDWTFWFYAAIVLLLGAICLSLDRGGVD
jgi:peptidoglycan/LPS O-acetylase OafA/YrhL